MESLKPPEPMKFDGNLASNWQRWLQSFEIYEVASGLHSKEEKLDTGAMCNVISKSEVKLLNVPIQKSEIKRLVTFSGNKMDTLGKVVLNCQYGKNNFVVEFQVIDKEEPSTLGLKSCLQLGLIQKVMSVNTEDLLEEYKDVFEGLGCLNGEYKIQLKQDVTPVIHPPRKIPIAIRDKVKQELQRMENLNLSENGLKPDFSKVEAIVKMPEPTDVPSLQRFLGMINYLAKFIPNLTTITAPLRQLLEKSVLWHWTEKHQKAFETFKELIAKAPVLKFYDVNKDVTLSVDASSEGLGAVLRQENQPIAYASRALTKSQKNYAQIEKELLAITFGCSKFHQYIYGKRITVETDHRPLESITKKPLFKAPQRLQRMLLNLQKYDLDVRYKKRKDLLTADTLSRVYLNTTEEDSDEDTEICTLIPATDEKIYELKKESECDATLHCLKKYILRGWPERKH
ncbi:Retrovirus-related Pol polyprotein from transposon 17.6, partial [Stegodyphus mimosarum]